MEGLKQLVFKDNYNSLEEYLQCFKYTVAVMQTPDAVERISYELAVDNFSEVSFSSSFPSSFPFFFF